MANLQELEQKREELMVEYDRLFNALDRPTDPEGLFLNRKNALKALADVGAKFSNDLNAWQEGWDKWDDLKRQAREEIRRLEQEVDDAPTEAMGTVLYDNLEEKIQAVKRHFDEEVKNIKGGGKAHWIFPHLIPDFQGDFNDKAHKLQEAMDRISDAYGDFGDLASEKHKIEREIEEEKRKEQNTE